MSAIGGIVRSNGSPVETRFLESMREVVRHRGGDGSGLWRDGNVGLIHQLLANTEESLHEKQPLTNDRGLWITADCRIDNREGLKGQFLAKGIPIHDSDPDVRYILAAYELWGEEAPGQLLGDFAFSVWDAPRRTLFCARDLIGMKPFYYHWDGKKFLFGSEIKQIFQDEAVSRTLYLPSLTDALMYVFPSREETPYAAIRKLPPGCAIRVGPTGFHLWKFLDWNPDNEPISRDSVQENAERFLEIFQEAVKARLRVPATHRAGVLLSGGIDSSAIAAVSARLMGNGRSDFKGSPLPVFSLLFPEADSEPRRPHADPIDERAYVRELAQKYPLERHLLEVAGWGSPESLRQSGRLWELPLLFPMMPYLHALFRTASERGVRVLMSGEGGDEAFIVGGFCFLQDLRRGRWIKFLRECSALRVRRGVPLSKILSTVAKGHLPEWLKEIYRKKTRRLLAERSIPDWIHPAFSQKIDLARRVTGGVDFDHTTHTSSSAGIRLWFSDGGIPQLLESYGWVAAHAGLELRMPFADFRLQRFCASLPWDQKIFLGNRKFLLRQAMRGILPEVIRQRPGKAEFTPVFRVSLGKYGKEMFRDFFEDPHPILQTLVDVDKAERFYQTHLGTGQKEGGRIVSMPLWYLWSMLSVNHWLRSQDGFVKTRREDRHGVQEELLSPTGGR